MSWRGGRSARRLCLEWVTSEREGSLPAHSLAEEKKAGVWNLNSGISMALSSAVFIKMIFFSESEGEEDVVASRRIQ